MIFGKGEFRTRNGSKAIVVRIDKKSKKFPLRGTVNGKRECWSMTGYHHYVGFSPLDLKEAWTE